MTTISGTGAMVGDGRRRMVLRPVQISARDRRHAAIHEAGHLVVARHLGRRLGCPEPDALIIRNDTALLPEERTWHGQINLYNIERLNGLERRMIGFAGAAATCLWNGEDLDLEFWSDPDFGGMSITDWQLAQCEPGQPDRLCNMAVTRLSRLLCRGGRLWKPLIREARALIIVERSSAPGQR
jgi:hypothetical protein